MRFPKCLLKQEHSLSLTEAWVCGLGQGNLEPEGKWLRTTEGKATCCLSPSQFLKGNLQGHQLIASKSQFSRL